MMLPAQTDKRCSVPRIAVRGINKSFHGINVLRSVSLTAQRGDVVALIGASGSGKSTLLRCINLLEVPDQGDIAIDGETIHIDRSRPGGSLNFSQIRRLRSSLGMVFQSFNLWHHMTVLENVVAAPVHVLKQPREQAEARATALLERVGIAEKRYCYPAQLSGGQQQRAAIARALAIEPKAILLDEPTSALDPELVAEVLKVIRDLALTGTTMILVTHELRFAREIASHIVFLHQGVIEEEGPPAQLLDDPRTEPCRRFVQSQFGVG
ncbi:MAG: ATP-binding cassette domain-containing protein [Pseudomonadota bacterium]